MHDSMKRKVLELLENYPINQRKIAVLRYELEHPVQVSPEEMIDAMTFRHGDGQGPTPGHISNKTLYIALNYQELTDAANAETRDSLASQLWELEQEQDRLLHYLSLLEERDEKILRMTYIDGLNNEQIAEGLSITSRRVTTLRSRAIDRLSGLYEYATVFH